MKQLNVFILAAFALFAPFLCRSGEPRPVIILKMDDLTSKGLKGKTEVRQPWNILHDFLASKKIRYGIGVHGETFVAGHQPTIDWIKRLHDSGNVEFWCHGFRSSRDKLPDGALEPAEFEGSYEEQKAVLAKCEVLAKEKLGFPLRSFGPHWSGVNAATAKALSEIPEIEVWFYAPADLAAAGGKYSYDRPVNLEDPIFVPDPVKFKAAWEKNGKTRKAIALQGHPQQWGWQEDSPRWKGFREIIEFLISEGCTFDTPYGYYEKNVLNK